MSDAKWFPKVGERVACVRNDHAQRYIKLATVLRIGKRDIVLDDGARFRVRDLCRDGGGDWSRWTVTLMRPDDPFVTKLRSEIRRANQFRTAEEACLMFTADRRSTPGLAADAILALAPLTGVEAEIRALFESPAPLPPRASEAPTEPTRLASGPSVSRGTAAGGDR